MGVGVVGTGSAAPVLEALAAGQVVAIPTDTVYGLAARLDRPDALAALFDLKGRPSGLALPVLIGRWGQLDEIAETWPRRRLDAGGALFGPAPSPSWCRPDRRWARSSGATGRPSGSGAPGTGSSAASACAPVPWP